MSNPLLPNLPTEGRAPAKVILSGEHSVVYGHPAVALAVNRWTRVRLHHRPGAATAFAPPATTNGPLLLEALTTVLPRRGIRISTETDIPIGRGMGSSASLAVATVRAHASAQGIVLDEATLHRQAFAIEKVFHGTPSGVDHSVIARGGAARFQRTDSGVQLTPLACPPLPLVVFDTGVAGSTRDLVAGVRSRRTELSDTLEAMGQLTERVITALRSPGPLSELGSLLTHNHRLLQALGVSTSQLDALVDFALQHGALGAKLSGAGGGGVVLALAPSPQTLLEHARKAGLAAFSVEVVPPEGSQP